MVKYLILVVLTVVLGFPHPDLRAGDKITIAVDEANPPFMYAGEKSDEAKGLYPFLLRAIFQRMQSQVEIEAYPWKRALSLGEKGEVGIGGIYKNEARLKIYDYSEVLFEEKLRLYVRKDQSFAFSNDNLSALQHKTIGVIRGWSYGDAFDQARLARVFEVNENNGDAPNFDMLSKERVDAVVAIEQAGERILAQKGYHQQLRALEVPLAINPTYLVFAKKLRKQPLVEQFNATLRTMKSDNSYHILIKEFFQAPEAQ